MKRALRALYLTLVVVLMTLVLPSPAQGAFGVDDCKDAPVAQAPGGGIAGFFASGTPATSGTGWANGAPKYDHYGMAGLTFQNYDLGCGPDIAKDPSGVVGTAVANWVMEGSKFAVGVTGALLDAAYHPTYLKVFDPLLIDATSTLRTAIFDQWVPLVLVVVGLILIWRARSMALATATAAFGWALLVMVIAVAVFNYPVQAGHAADTSVGNVLGAVNEGINGQGKVADPVDAATASVSNSVLFEQWKMGTFGRSNSPTAEKYAEAIYTNQALTYAEAKTVQDDPDGKGKALIDRKATAWEDAAAKIKAEDPDAYQYLTGHRGETRVAASLVSAVAALCVTPFLVVSALMLIGAFLLIRLAVVFFPVIATVGIAYQARGAVKGVGMVVAAAVINSIMFGIGTAVTILAARILLTPSNNLPLWLSLALMAVFSFIMWVAMKPLRRLTAMASPSNVFSDAAGAIGDTGRRAVDAGIGIGKAAVGAYLGTGAALDRHDDITGHVPDRSEGYSREPKEYRWAAEPSTDTDTAPPPALSPAPTPTKQPEPVAATSSAAGLPAGASSNVPPAPPGTPALGSSTTPRDADETPTVFTPGVDPPQPYAGPLPTPTEPEIDVDTGDEIYTLFRPDAEAGSEQ